MSIPVFFSLVAEPITGMIDTAFVKELGAVEAAALGVGTVALSSVFWIFNFLGIGTQTEVARNVGADDRARARGIASLACLLCVTFGIAMLAIAWVASDHIAAAMAATGETRAAAGEYISIRAFGAPAVLLMAACFGALRGLQDMRAPMWIAVFANALNVGLDWVLIFGIGPIPACGIAGAAWATVAAQWSAAVWAVLLVRRKLGFTRAVRWRDAHSLLVVGLDLLLRTGFLTAFLLITTYVATATSDDAGAAHTAIRSVWMFTALTLDAYAATAQSLIGFFRGRGDLDLMRRVAKVACQQCTALGFVLIVGMLATTNLTASLLVPNSAHAVFATAWWLAAIAQPLNAIAFATDGIHWGTADYRYLRNAMFASSLPCAAWLLLIDRGDEHALAWIWGITGVWITIRAVFGLARIWPGRGPWVSRSDRATSNA